MSSLSSEQRQRLLAVGLSEADGRVKEEIANTSALRDKGVVVRHRPDLSYLQFNGDTRWVQHYFELSSDKSPEVAFLEVTCFLESEVEQLCWVYVKEYLDDLDDPQDRTIAPEDRARIKISDGDVADLLAL